MSISGGNSSVTAGTVGSKLFEISGKYNINNHILELITESGERGSTVFGWHQNTELKRELVIGDANYKHSERANKDIYERPGYVIQ